MQERTKLYIILSVIFSVILFAILYKFILFPSYLSIASSCFVDGDEIVAEAGYYTVGSFTVSDNQTVIAVTIPDLTIVRHEECHKKQWEENRIYDCNNINRMYFNEVEAYLAQYRLWRC